MGQPSDLLASATVGFRSALRDGLRLRSSVVVAGSSAIPSAVGVAERISRGCLPDATKVVDHPTISEAATGRTIQLQNAGLFGGFFESLPAGGDARHKGLARLPL